MGAISIYIDEDAMDSDLVAALRSRKIPVTTVTDAGMVGKDDEEQLAFAADSDCVIYTYNIADFHRLHILWMNEGRQHAGIILAPQQRFSVGERLHRVLRLRSALTAERIRNRVEFLSSRG